jgi:hypothetical protein
VNLFHQLLISEADCKRLHWRLVGRKSLETLNSEIMTAPMDYVITAILFANGLYDIICGCSIMWLSESVQPFKLLATLHPTMFIDKEHSEHPVIKRLLAYWLLTYGFARLFAGVQQEFYLDVVAAITYFLEALCYEYERWVGKTVVSEKVTFVSLFSSILGILVLLRPFGVYN